MLPMRCTECIIDINLRKRSKSLAEIWVVFLLLPVKTQILKQQNIPFFHFAYLLVSLCSHAVFCKFNRRPRSPHYFCKPLRNWLEGILWVGLTGSPQM